MLFKIAASIFLCHFAMAQNFNYISGNWGYNRGWFRPSNTTIFTPDGMIEIDNAIGKDRPSSLTFENYIVHPTIPQYSYEIAFNMAQVRPGLTLVLKIGQDHMKWVLDNKRNYNFRGQYADVYIKDGDQVEQVSFEEAVKRENLSFLHYERTDGHNIFHISFGAYQDIAKIGKVVIQMGPDIGIGPYIPKPHFRFLDKNGQYQGQNGRFQLAGFNAIAGAKLRLINFEDRFMGSWFLEATGRMSWVKTKDNIYNAGGRDYQKGEFTVSNEITGTLFSLTVGKYFRLKKRP